METQTVVRLDRNEAARFASAVRLLERHKFLPVRKMTAAGKAYSTGVAALVASITRGVLDHPESVDDLLAAMRSAQLADPQLYEVAGFADLVNEVGYALYLMTDGRPNDYGIERARTAAAGFAGSEAAAIYMVLSDNRAELRDSVNAGVSFSYAPPHPDIADLTTSTFAPFESYSGDPDLAAVAIWLEIILHELLELTPGSGIDPHPVHGITSDDGESELEQWDWVRDRFYGMLQHMQAQWPVDIDKASTT